jgi:hypothetical protein
MNNDSVLDAILADFLWMFGIVGALIATAIGLLLVLAPGRALKVGDFLSREWSFAWFQRALDEPRHSEPFIYRHHRIVGFLLLVATLYFFWTFATAYSTAALVALYEGYLPRSVLELLATALTWVLVIGNALGFALGVIMLLRPSALKGVEATANTWVDTDRAAEVLNRRDDRPEGVAHRYPRRIGATILLATLYVVLIAWFTLK